MIQKIYQVDAFAEEIFSGNPAAVCPLDEWLSDELMQNIAAENNLAETAFYVKKDNIFELRWFTPEVEVDLCGHATLATAFVIFNLENFEGDTVEFFSPRSGTLTVKKEGDFLVLNFPADEVSEIEISDDILHAFDDQPRNAYKGKTDLMLLFEKENDIQNLTPQFNVLEKMTEYRGVICTAPGDEVDFVSRFFGPQVGVKEDPVTGSAHTTLTPFWAEKLEKTEMTALQLSKRKGLLKCKFLGERVEIGGKAKLYMTGEIIL